MSRPHFPMSSRLLLARLMAAAAALGVASAGLWLGAAAFSARANAEPVVTACSLILSLALVRFAGVCWGAIGQLAHTSTLAHFEAAPFTAGTSVQAGRTSRVSGAGSAAWSLRLASFFLAVATAILGAGNASAKVAPPPSTASVAALPAPAAPSFDALPAHPSFAPLLSVPLLKPADTACQEVGPGWKPIAPTHCDVLLGASRASDSGTPQSYVVKRGDTLWGIASQHLAAGASAPRIAASVQDWVRANPSLIDPSSLHVGDVLVRPRTSR